MSVVVKGNDTDILFNDKGSVSGDDNLVYLFEPTPTVQVGGVNDAGTGIIRLGGSSGGGQIIGNSIEITANTGFEIHLPSKDISIAANGNTTIPGIVGAITITTSPTGTPASTTNSGMVMGGATNYSLIQFFDSTRTANNRTAEEIFLNGSHMFRFKSDSQASASTWLAASGGNGSGITGILSSSGSGIWSHTGNYVATGTITSLPVGGNSVILTGSVNGGTPTISTDGSNVNVSLQINTKGAGGIVLNSATNVVGAFTQNGGNVVVTQSVGGQFSIIHNNAALSGPQAAFTVQGNNANGPAIGIGNTSQGTDAKWWDIMPVGLTLNFRTVTDAGVPVSTFLQVTRAGSSVSAIASNSGAGAWSHTGNHFVSGVLGVGTVSPAAGAALDISSTTKGFLPPRMTKAQLLAMASPTDGLVAFVTDLGAPALAIRVGASWYPLTAGAPIV